MGEKNLGGWVWEMDFWGVQRYRRTHPGRISGYPRESNMTPLNINDLKH